MKDGSLVGDLNVKDGFTEEHVMQYASFAERRVSELSIKNRT